MNYDYLTSNIKVSITSFQQSKTDSNTVFYTLQLQAKDNKWYVEKRFSQFDQLVTALKTNYHSLPLLPKKSYIFKLNQKELEARQAGLEDFLRKIIIRNDLMNSELIKQFLQLDKNASEIMVKPPRLQLEYTIEGATKGIRDYYFIQQKNIFLIVTADMSLVQKFKSKFTNTKLPWQAEGGKFNEVGSLQAWQCDMNSSKFIKLWSKGYPQEAICLSYDEATSKILVGLSDGDVDFLIMNQSSFENLACDKIHTGRVNGLFYDSLSNVVFSISQDKIFRTSHGSSLSLIVGLPHKEQLLTMIKDQLNKRVFIGTKIGQSMIYDISQAEKPKLLTILRSNKGGPIKALFLDNSRNYLFSGGFETGQINVFDLDKPGREKLAKLNATMMGKEKIRTITWSAKRAEIITGTSDGSITFWNAIKGKSIYVLKAFDNEISRIDFVPEKDILISASKGKSIKIWQLPKEWRDIRLVAAEDKQQDAAIREIIKSTLASKLGAAKEDSDDDDLAGWHLD